MQDGHDDVAELLAGGGAQGAAHGLHDVHRAAARIGEQHAVDARHIHAFGEAAGIGDEGAFGVWANSPMMRARVPVGVLPETWKVSSLPYFAEGVAEGVVVGLEQFRPLDAAVEGDGVADRDAWPSPCAGR